MSNILTKNFPFLRLNFARTFLQSKSFLSFCVVDIDIRSKKW